MLTTLYVLSALVAPVYGAYAVIVDENGVTINTSRLDKVGGDCLVTIKNENQIPNVALSNCSFKFEGEK